MPTPTLHLTKSSILGAAPGEYQDDETKYLRLVVSPDGSTRSFMVYRWRPATETTKGSAVRKVIGRYPAMNVAQARERAPEVAKEIVTPPPPPTPEEIEAEVPKTTLRELVTLYTAKLAAGKAKRPRWLEKIVNRVFPDWLDLPLDKITRGAIALRHDKVAAERGIQSGAASVRVMRALFEFAIDREIFNGANIAKHVETMTCKPRQVVLTPDQKKALLEALAWPGYPEWVDPFFRLLLLTGVRRGNLAGALWKDIDLDNAVWRIPARSSKSGNAMNVYLRAEAVEILRRRVGLSETYVFPSPRPSTKSHIKHPQVQFAQVLKRASIEGIRPHDLRRTFGSELINAGNTLPVVAAAMGHTDPATTAKYYAVVNESAVREALAMV